MNHVAGGARRTGVEQEFVVHGPSGPVDFARWLRAGAVPGKRLDRGDPHAHRQRCGGVITADGREAEIATPPAPLAPGFTGSLASSLGRLRRELERVVGDDAGQGTGGRLEGASTHLNVEVADRRVVRTARRFAETHSAAMMLLLDRRDSPGLLVRPRRARLEIGGEYAAGTQLTAAAVFAAAATLDCERLSPARPLARPSLEAARERFGWYVDRRAYGADLYRDGRLARVGRYCAQDLLDWSWTRVRATAELLADPAEVAAVDAIVDGRHPLPCEAPDDDASAYGRAAAEEPAAGDQTIDLTADRWADSVSLSPLIVTWDHTVFELRHRGTVRYVGLPAHRAAEFVEAFASGRLVDWTRRVMQRPVESLPVLASTKDVKKGGVFGGLRSGLTLALAERHPVTGRLSGVGGVPGSREHKHDAHEHPRRPRHTPKPKGSGSHSWMWTAGAAGVAVPAVVVASVAVFGAEKEPKVPQAAVGSNAPADPAATGGTQPNSTAAPTTSSPTAPTATSPTTPTASATTGQSAAAVAQSMAGTYAVTTTVTDGNSSQPVGTVAHRTITLKLDCSAPDTCTLAADGAAGTISGGVLRFAGTFTEPCPDGSGSKATDRYDLTLRLTGGGDGIRGVQHIETVNPEVCDDVVNDPVAFSWVAVRN